MKLLQIKAENILALFYTPALLVNLIKTDSNLFLVALVLHISLLAVTYYGIKNTRQELIADIRNGEYEELIEELDKIKALIKALLKGIAITFLETKKKLHRSNQKRPSLKDAYLKYNF